MVLVQTRVTLPKYVSFAAGEYRQWPSGKCSVPEFRHSQFPIPELARLELALLNLLRQLDSANGDRRVVESFEPEHRPNPLFHSPVILFDQFV